MAQRPSSPGPNSSASSSLDVSGMSISKKHPHPEEWTLPHEWNIEKREMFENWKMDVQNQISNLAYTLGGSLKKHPREDVRDFDYSHVIRQNMEDDEYRLRERTAGNTLNYGVARVPVPDKY